MSDPVNVDVLVIGAGPAGLTAAAELRRLGVGRVLVADREVEPGGVPRHSQHTGYGLRDLHRVMTGPAYARALTDAALRAGAEVRAGCTVTALRADGAETSPGLATQAHGATQPGPERLTAVLTSALGVEAVLPSAVLLATGCRERPRPARLVPGDRPAGVMTTGELQQRVYLAGERLTGRALIVGAEHVAFSAAVTLAHAGARVIALVTEHERHQSYAAFRAGAALRWRTPVWTSAVVTNIVGPGGRLAGVEITDAAGGHRRYVPCDLIVFTGDWIPDHALARTAGLAIDPGTKGPVVDTTLATMADGVFAAGNLIHAAETADIAALSGRHAARQIAARLAGQPGPAADRQAAAGPPAAGSAADRPAPAADPGGPAVGPRATARVPIEVEAPLRWISPNAIIPASPPPLGRFTLRTARFHRPARLEVRQGGRLLARSRPQRLIPGRPVHLPAAWLPAVDPAGGPVRVTVQP